MVRKDDLTSYFLQSLICSAGLLFATSLFAAAQGGSQARPLISQTVDESKLVTLHGNVRPEASGKNDRGPVADDLPMEHMFLQLRRPPELEAELRQFIEDLHN